MEIPPGELGVGPADQFGRIFDAALEYEQKNSELQADIDYVRDRLVSRNDPDRHTITIRKLIDEATNSGDFFPASELKRRKEQIHEINRHFAEHVEFTDKIIADCKQEVCSRVKRLRFIVDKLPKTADGVSVVPYKDNVWCEHEGVIVQSKDILWAELHWMTKSNEKRWWARFPADGFYKVVELCYSTQEAVEAAKGSES